MIVDIVASAMLNRFPKHTSAQRAYHIECRDPLVLFEKKRITLFRIPLALDLSKRYSPIKIKPVDVRSTPIPAL